MKNTKQKGKFRLFAYQEASDYYIGVCPEFDLVQEGDCLAEALTNIQRASINYLKTIIKFKMDDDLLNKEASPEHWKKYRCFLKEEKKRRFWERYLKQMLYDKTFPKFLKEKLPANV